MYNLTSGAKKSNRPIWIKNPYKNTTISWMEYSKVKENSSQQKESEEKEETTRPFDKIIMT